MFNIVNKLNKFPQNVELLRNNFKTAYCINVRNKRNLIEKQKIRQNDKLDVSSVVLPFNLKKNENNNFGKEIVGKKINGVLLNKTLNKFYRQPSLRKVCQENGIDEQLLQKSFISFRRHCLDLDNLETELYVILNDIIYGNNHVDDLHPFFLKYCKKIFPHLNCLEELKKISDLRLPINWYPEARKKARKIFFHSGPTNSGKTYNALKKFLEAEKAIYCGPLKLLAVEVFNKSNDLGVPCDLLTGDDKIFVQGDEIQSDHLSCTVEIVSTQQSYDIAIIDEIQMIKDFTRGYAWTRALLGIQAEEIHLCGESSAINIIKEILSSVGEELIVKNYQRLSPLEVSSKALGSLENVLPGDCIVCFNKNNLFKVCMELEELGKQFSVIYGSLPPATKINQAKKFNDPNDPCKILVATDAIGMGLNLSIKRVVFYSLTKPNDEKEIENISTSTALQIGGRAGRFNLGSDTGLVTTLREEELPILKKIWTNSVPDISSIGIFPNAEQLELFAYHLPHATLKELIDIFISVCQVDTSNYFMCNLEAFKQLAELIEHIPLPLSSRYTLCLAPVDLQNSFVCTIFIKFCRSIAENDPMSFDSLSSFLKTPFQEPTKIQEMIYLESVFDIFELYLWLNYRFPFMFPDTDLVKQSQKVLDELINKSVSQITKLFHNKKINLNQKIVYKPKQIKNLESIHKLFDEDENPGALTQKLLNSGLLTTNMIKQLKKEWKVDSENEDKKKKM